MENMLPCIGALQNMAPLHRRMLLYLMFDCQNHLINQQRGRTNKVITENVRSQEFERI